MKLKKQSVDLTDMAIGIVVLGIVVTIGSYILITQRDSRLTDLSTVTTVNETVSHPSDILANSWVKSVSTCYNGTQATVISTGNYSVSISPVDGYATITNTTGTYGATDWKCTYTWYNTSRADWTLANNSSVGLAEYGNWFKVIVIVGVATLVLSIIFLAFGNRGKGANQGY